jgi:hypothetical protein
MTDRRSLYLDHALSQLPRILSLQDRNPFSPTYGSFNRLYWLDKTHDFPDGMAQFAVQPLALVYANPFPNNPYVGQQKIREWIVAGLDYWARIQHADGSLDEYYPYERGWVGPTGFTLYASIEAFRAVREHVPPETAERVIGAIRRAAQFVAAGEAEEDRLANHHAAACLAVWDAWELLEEPSLRRGFDRIWRTFLTYRNPREHWWLEYDGIDPGYLSATVSFLAKLYQRRRLPEVREMAREAIEVASYFAYPDGYYAGSLGSRQTLHFYPHGCEVLADEIPLAGALAEHLLQGLGNGALVPPSIMPDRYMPWRAAEYLLAYRDSRPHAQTLPDLPFQAAPFHRWLPEARVDIRRTDDAYLLANLAKGGVVKLFDPHARLLLLSDCGILGQEAGGKILTTQWVDPSYQVDVGADEITVSGSLQRMSSTTLFTPLKLAAFRVVTEALGRSPRASHAIKGAIRRALMFGTRAMPIRFQRRISLRPGEATITDALRTTGDVRLTGLLFGDEHAVRYVPQSRFFQLTDLTARGYALTPEQLATFQRRGQITVTRRVAIPSGDVWVEIDGQPVSASDGLLGLAAAERGMLAAYPAQNGHAILESER